MSAHDEASSALRWVVCQIDRRGNTLVYEDKPVSGRDAHARASQLNQLNPGASFWPERVYDESLARTDPPNVE